MQDAWRGGRAGASYFRRDTGGGVSSAHLFAISRSASLSPSAFATKPSSSRCSASEIPTFASPSRFARPAIACTLAALSALPSTGPGTLRKCPTFTCGSPCRASRNR